MARPEDGAVRPAAPPREERPPAGDRSSLSRRDFVKSAGVVGLATLMLTATSFQAPRLFGVTRHRHAIRGLREPLALALLTDLHLGPYLGEDDLERWVETTRDLEPDLVLLGGDIVDSRYRGTLEELGRQLPKLEAPLGVYAVLGNHDHTRYRRPDELVAALTGAGATLLDNSAAQVREDLVLAGIDDLRVGRPDARAAFEDAFDLGAGGEDPSRPALAFLSHNPDVIPALPDAPDLLLAGHTHGGQVRLPLIGAVATSSRYGRRYLEGWVDAPMPAFVSRGLGVTGVPFRYDCPAELALIRLEPA